ncbi:MAG: FKBP-type peptidyl-prolyl cis-trans isomerase [Mariniblastus sp.]|nr:FKBP-type peptidyl-prolyl cis-trans isomerase [Mariniblastus sp.]MDG2182084.1 FKBP-type peptidyl-prolyl cis-trans isomerase [Mariniblastus sp.]
MKRRARNKQRRRRNRLDFQSLEPRRLLAGDSMAPHQVSGELPASTNLVVNGDFEDVVEGGDRFFDETEVGSWEAFDAETGQQINIFDYNVDGYHNVLDLDSTSAQFDRVFQRVDTDAGEEYLVTFDYRSHPTVDVSASPRTNDFEIWWDGDRVGTYTGGDSWNTGAIVVTAGDLDTTVLLFCEIQEDGFSGGDGRGALLDNIRVVKANSVNVANGGFETTDASDSVFYKPDQVDSWGAVAATNPDRWLKIFEGNAAEGNQYLNLDTTETHRDIAYQDLTTEAGASYYVTFSMKTDGDQSVSSDELRVRWNGSWATTVFGTDTWETYGVMVTADSDTTRLTFLEPGESTGDGSGPLVDDIQMFVLGDQTLSLDFDESTSGDNGAFTYSPGTGSRVIASEVVINHAGDGDLTSAVVTLNGAVDGSSELLAVLDSSVPTDGQGQPLIAITNYDSATNQLTLSGAATAAEYQQVIRTLHYFNAAEDVTVSDRTVTVAVSASSSTASASVVVSIETDQTLIDAAIIEQYIADNALDATPATEGLYVVIDDPGAGQNPTINSTVRVKYDGKFIELNAQNQLVDGDSFDVSSESGATFPLANVIRGWQLGIPLFKTGGVGKLIIPSGLAYGASGSGSIPPNSVLVFDVELQEIVS